MLIPACNEKHFKGHVNLIEIFPDDFTADFGKQLKCLTTMECMCPQCWVWLCISIQAEVPILTYFPPAVCFRL